MDLTHRFTVPVGVEESWAHFNDIASVAECFPGAQVTSAEGDSFAGTVKVKLGPIALVYNGTGTFVEKDEACTGSSSTPRARTSAATALPAPPSPSPWPPAQPTPARTDVEVVTDLAITGKPAQFGRGVMQDVSDKLLGQFVACLEERLATPSATSAAPPPASELVTDRVPDPVPDPVPPVDPGEAVTSDAAAVEPAPPPRSASPPRMAPADPAPPKKDDALNLGSAVLPVLAKAYWKQALVALVVVVVFLILVL